MKLSRRELIASVVAVVTGGKLITAEHNPPSRWTHWKIYNSRRELLGSIVVPEEQVFFYRLVDGSGLLLRGTGRRQEQAFLIGNNFSFTDANHYG